MVESGKTVRELKQLLSAQVGCSRFEQRLFSDEIGELQDDVPLGPLPTVRLVVPPLCALDSEKLLLSCRVNNVIDVERQLQRPLDPDGGGLFVAAENGHLEVVRLLLDAGADTSQTSLIVSGTPPSTSVPPAGRAGRSSLGGTGGEPRNWTPQRLALARAGGGG